MFSPAKIIFAGAGVLLAVSTLPDTVPITHRFDTLASQAAKDVSESQDALVDIFERVENFFKRLETYIEVPPTAAMTDISVKIMVEVLNIFAISTKEIKQGRTSTCDSLGYLVISHFFSEKYLKKLAGRTDLEDALKRLEKLSQEETRMAAAQLLKITHNIANKITQVMDGKRCTLSWLSRLSKPLCG